MDKGREYVLRRLTDPRVSTDFDAFEAIPHNELPKEELEAEKILSHIRTIELSAYTKLKSERDAAVEALRFYANKDNWMRDKNGWRHDMITEDLDDESLTYWNGRFSGKRARAVLAMIDKGEK